MNRAEDLTEHVEASQLVCNESDVEAITGGECESAIEIVGYSETVSLGSVVVPDVNDDILAKGDIHDRPWTGMVFAIIESHVEPFVCHHDCENSRVS